MLPREAYASRKKVFAPLSALRVFFQKAGGGRGGAPTWRPGMARHTMAYSSSRVRIS